MAGLGLLVFTSGCAPMPTVALEATPADLEILAGEWTGEYESAALGRRGSIEFKLKAGTERGPRRRADGSAAAAAPRTSPSRTTMAAVPAQHAAVRSAHHQVHPCVRTDRSPAGSIAIGIPIAIALRDTTFHGHVGARDRRGHIQDDVRMRGRRGHGHVDRDQETREAERGMEIAMSETRELQSRPSLRPRLRVRGDVSRGRGHCRRSSSTSRRRLAKGPGRTPPRCWLPRSATVSPPALRSACAKSGSSRVDLTAAVVAHVARNEHGPLPHQRHRRRADAGGRATAIGRGSSDASACSRTSAS